MAGEEATKQEYLQKHRNKRWTKGRFKVVEFQANR